MFVTAGKSRPVIAVQVENAYPGTVVNEGRFTVTSDVQFAKADCPMLVAFGKLTVVTEEQ